MPPWPTKSADFAGYSVGRGTDAGTRQLDFGMRHIIKSSPAIPMDSPLDSVSIGTPSSRNASLQIIAGCVSVLQEHGLKTSKTNKIGFRDQQAHCPGRSHNLGDLKQL